MRRSLLAFMMLVLTGAGAGANPPDELLRRSQERRAVEAVIWGMPAVNTELMYDQMLKAGGNPGQVIYWGKPSIGTTRP